VKLTDLLVQARALGAVTVQSVEGVGWQCNIRPPHVPGHWSNRGLNSWTGTARTLTGSVSRALEHARKLGEQTRDGATYAPKLGGDEFDRG
jgi:hypothetical protein